MFPLEEVSPVHQTQVCKRTINPVYHEIFTFSVREQTLQEAKLVVQVCDILFSGFDVSWNVFIIYHIFVLSTKWRLRKHLIFHLHRLEAGKGFSLLLHLLTVQIILINKNPYLQTRKFLCIFGGHQSFLWGHWYLYFGLLVTFALDFKGKALTCILCHLCAMDSSDSPLVRHLFISWWPA